MKRLLGLLAMLLGGAALGGGAAFGVAQVMPPAPAAAAKDHAAPEPEDDGPPQFVPVELLVPLVYADGQLASYATVKLQLRVDEAAVEDVTARIPLLQHAINLQTYRTPLALGADGRIPDLGALRGLVQRSADQTVGKGRVRQVAIVEARS